MNTPIQAMLWELWRTSRMEFLGRISFHCLIAVWAATAWSADNDAELGVLRSVLIVMLSFGSVFSVTWMSALDNRSSGFCFPLTFARPISSTQLVLVPMLFTMVMAVVTFLIPVGLFCYVGSAPVPLVGFSVGIACAVACFVATAWSPTTSIGRWISVIAVLIGFVTLFVVFHIRRGDPEPWLLVMGRPDYFQFAWYYYVMCFVVSAIAAAIAVSAVDRQRHGDKWEFFEFVAGVFRLPNVFDRRSACPEEPFRSEFAAQFWCDMHRIGRKVLPCAICAPLLPLAWVVSAPLFAEKEAIWRGTPTIWLAGITFSPLFFQGLGAEAAVGLKRRQGAAWMSPFDAANPMASDRLAAVKLIALSICSLAGWLCMLACAGLHSTVVGNWEVWGQIVHRLSAVAGDVSSFWWLAGVAAFVLLCISTTAIVLTFMLWVARHEGQFTFLIMTGMFHGGLAVASDIFKWDLSAYWITAGYAMAAGTIVICGVALYRAYSAGYFSKPLLQLTLVLWAIYVASTIACYVQVAPEIANHFTVPLPLLAIAASSLIVPLAATAAAPVAFDSHRHC